MVKKILNWTANGFFRSLGKFLFFFLITCLIAILVGNGSLKLTDLLGIEVVYAETNANYSSIKLEVEQCTIRPSGSNVAFNNCVWDSRTGTGSGNKISFGSSNGYLRKIQFQFYGGSNYNYPSGSYRLQIKLAQEPLDIYAFNNYYQMKIYGNTSSSSTGASSGFDTISSKSCTYSQSSTYVGIITCVFGTAKDLKYFNFSLEYLDDNDVRLYNTNNIYWYSIDQFTFTTDSTGAINNQTTIIQNEFQNLDNTLTDTDSDIDSSDMVDFLNDLSLTNEGIVSTFVNLPISIIESLVLNNSNNSICATFRGQNLCLPSGVIVWGRNNPNCNLTTNLACANTTSVNAFKNFFSLVVGGWWSYLMLKSVVSTIDNVVDPFKDRIEVSKL